MYKDVYTNVYDISACTITPAAASGFPFNGDVIPCGHASFR